MRQTANGTSWIGVLFIVGLGGCSTSISPDGGAVDAGVDVDAFVEDSAMPPRDSGMDSAVDAGMSDDAGFDAGFDAGPPCPIQGTLTLPADEVAGRLSGPSENRSTTCTPADGTGGPEHYYELHVTDRIGITISVASIAEVVVAIRTACDDPLSEVACYSPRTGVPGGSLSAILEPGDYFVLADVYGLGVGGDYTLTLDSFAPAANATCSTATPVADGTMLAGQTFEGAVSTTLTTLCPELLPVAGMPVPTLWYAATLPPGTRLTAAVMPTDLLARMAVAVFPGCSPSASCLAAGFRSSRYTNTSSGPQTVMIAVQTAPPLGGPAGAFDLSITYDAPPANATCSMATPVGDGDVVTGDITLGATDRLLCPATGREMTGLLYYTVTIPPGEILRATSLGGATIWLLNNCAGMTCLADSSGTSSNQLVYANPGASPVTATLVVGGFDTPLDGRFELSVEIDPAAANSTCAGAIALSSGTPVTGDTSLSASVSVSCASPFVSISGAHYYSVTIPAGEIVRLSAMPTGGAFWWLGVGVLNSCASGMCLTGDPSGTGRLAYANATGAPVDVIVVVGWQDVWSGGSFELRADVGPPPASAVCATATPVTDGTLLLAQDTADGVDNLASTCEPLATQSVLYYSASIPAGETLTAIVSTTMFTPIIRVLANCGAATCLASRAGRPNRVDYTNGGVTTEDVLIAVSPSGSGRPGDPRGGLFDLSIAITPSTHLETTLPTSCDDMSLGTLVPGPIYDDSVSGFLPLPFAFSIAGDAVTHFSVSSNGLVQLYPSGFGSRSTSSANVPLPSTGAPPGIIAAFWDDLAPQPGAAVRTLTSGTAPDRQLTIEWANYSYYMDPASAMRFQAKLFESTNVIELHYCSMGPSSPTRFGGASATIGAQNLAGTAGFLHSFDMPGAVDTTTALRFTPAP